MNEPIAIEPKSTSDVSWWIGSRPEGFTALACEAMHAKVLLDDVSDREFQIIAQRQHMLSALIGLGRGRQTHGLRHAIVLSRN